MRSLCKHCSSITFFHTHAFLLPHLLAAEGPYTTHFSQVSLEFQWCHYRHLVTRQQFAFSPSSSHLPVRPLLSHINGKPTLGLTSGLRGTGVLFVQKPMDRNLRDCPLEGENCIAKGKPQKNNKHYFFFFFNFFVLNEVAREV